MSSHAPRMDVKVLYTLDSSPDHTMIARLGRPVPVEIIIPNMTPPSPLGPSSSNYQQSPPPPRQVRFGRVPLKTCLGAVCMASPELLPDDKRDYIIYAVDPEETLRASQLPSPGSSRGHASPTRSSSASNSSCQRNDASTSKLSSSPPRPKVAAPSILVGKGFFNWALEEQGEGETAVTGRVRSDGRRLRYENGREYEEDINVLEVVIKLKESQARSKDKYFNLVRGLASGSSSSFSAGAGSSSGSSSGSRTASSRHTQNVEVVSAAHRFRSSHLALHSEPHYPTTSSSSSYGAMERQIRRPAARIAGDRISPKTATAPLGASPGMPLLSNFSNASSPPAAAASAPSPNSAAAAAVSNPSALQLLTILHSLQQRSSKSAPEPAQQAQLETLLQQVAQAIGNTSSSSLPAVDAASTTDHNTAGSATTSPNLSFARPLDPIPVPNESNDNGATIPRSSSTQPAGKENRSLGLTVSSKDSPQTLYYDSHRPSASSPPLEESTEDSSAPSQHRKESAETSDRICYNCGTDVPTTWRLLRLPAGSIINNPAAEKSSSDSTNDDSSETGWKPRYAGREGPIETDGETRWSACNPCGLYYLKWDNSRPEYVWRKEHATKAYRERKALAEAAKRRREEGGVVGGGANKRARIVAGSDVDAASPYSMSTPGLGMSPNFDAGTPVSSSARKGSMPRTLSEACHRDAEKLESQRSDRKRDNEKPVCKKQADREYVLDPSTGKWRSRRSMRENPQGKKPGRPKGSVKVQQNGSKAQHAKSSPAQGSKESSGNTPSAQRQQQQQQSQSQSQSQSKPQPSSSSTPSKQPATASTGSETADNSQPKSTPQAEPSASNSNSKPDQLKSDPEFRLPQLPPSTRHHQTTSSSGLVNFAQSSPVRPSMNASLMQPEAINSSMMMPPFGSGMLESPSRDIRFRVPSYLMNSSPGTMLDTLMSEADFDFEELGPLGPLQTPGTLLGNMAKGLRRSPRKNSANPYASPSAKRGGGGGSPTFGRGKSVGSPAMVTSSNDSPVTRSRTRLGGEVLHPGLYSSSDGLGGNANGKSSSNVTSPASPSEKRRKTTPRTTNTTSKPSTTTTTTAMEEEDNEESEQHFTKGPYSCTTTTTSSSSREGSADLPSCPASPSLGRTSRKLARNLSTASSNTHFSSGRAKLAHLDLPPSSPVFDHPSARSGGGREVEVDGWGRTPSMREIFPTPSDLDWPSDGSPRSPFPRSPDASAANEAKQADGEKAEKKEEEKTAQTHAVVRRRPLPATVEDGSSSISGSSPALTDSPEESNLFDLLEDPYGILAASGFGVDADGTLTTNPTNANAQVGEEETQMTPTSSTPSATTAAAPSISADRFNQIHLHPSTSFSSHLNAFTTEGGAGIAAHVNPNTNSPAAVQIGPSSTSTSTSTIRSNGGETNGFDMSFLANLPPELSTIFSTPGKKIPPQIIEILASPRKSRTRSSSRSPSKMALGKQMVVTPNYSTGESGEGEQDFSALFNNPDIQALLAEFEAQS
ncbi:hypothetical protein NDA13_000937 [Ustilago tritici]|nr:hypothetical protein NDA13_000937 [Ustilago tritici]